MVHIGDRVTRVPVTFDRLDDKCSEPEHRFGALRFGSTRRNGSTWWNSTRRAAGSERAFRGYEHGRENL